MKTLKQLIEHLKAMQIDEVGYQPARGNAAASSVGGRPRPVVTIDTSSKRDQPIHPGTRGDQIQAQNIAKAREPQAYARGEKAMNRVSSTVADKPGDIVRKGKEIQAAVKKINENDVAKQNLGKTLSAVNTQNQYSNVGKNIAGLGVAAANARGIGTPQQQARQIDTNFNKGKQAGDFGLGSSLGTISKAGSAYKSGGINKVGGVLGSQSTQSSLDKAKQDSASTLNRVRQLSNKDNVPGHAAYTSRNPSIIPRKPGQGSI